MSVRHATAHWEGGLKSGNGTMKLGSGAFEGPFSFATRFGETPGTNPEELVGAAHAGCFSMAFSANLEGAGFPPTSVDTTAKVHLNTTDAGPTVDVIELECKATVPGIDEAQFQELANKTKQTCPISRLLAAADIRMTATLVAG